MPTTDHPYHLFIAGLGNPGARYQRTRHNLGFMLMDRVAAKLEEPGSFTPSSLKGKADCLGGIWAGRRILLIKPLTFMNDSGGPLAAVCRWFRVDIERQLMVVYDDLDIPLGEVRLRPKGSAGTHNGMASVVEVLGGQNFARLRLGIGPKPDQWDAADFVLSEFLPNERPTVEKMLDRGESLLEAAVKEGVELAISKHQRHG